MEIDGALRYGDPTLLSHTTLGKPRKKKAETDLECLEVKRARSTTPFFIDEWEQEAIQGVRDILREHISEDSRQQKIAKILPLLRPVIGRKIEEVAQDTTMREGLLEYVLATLGLSTDRALVRAVKIDYRDKREIYTRQELACENLLQSSRYSHQRARMISDAIGDCEKELSLRPQAKAILRTGYRFISAQSLTHEAASMDVGDVGVRSSGNRKADESSELSDSKSVKPSLPFVTGDLEEDEVEALNHIIGNHSTTPFFIDDWEREAIEAVNNIIKNRDEISNSLGKIANKLPLLRPVIGRKMEELEHTVSEGEFGWKRIFEEIGLTFDDIIQDLIGSDYRRNGVMYERGELSHSVTRRSRFENLFDEAMIITEAIAHSSLYKPQFTEAEFRELERLESERKQNEESSFQSFLSTVIETRLDDNPAPAGALGVSLDSVQLSSIPTSSTTGVDSSKDGLVVGDRLPLSSPFKGTDLDFTEYGLVGSESLSLSLTPTAGVGDSTEGGLEGVRSTTISPFNVGNQLFYPV